MSKQIIEIYLFIDPLGRKCNSVRKIVKQFREQQVGSVKLRIIPMINSKKVFGYTRKQINRDVECIVDKNNRFLTNTYKASLAFHASTMQGRKFGDAFLNALQQAVIEENQSFSEEIVFQVAEEIDSFDLEMFKEDYQSELAKNIYRKSLQLASEMNVTKTPSCVIFKNGTEEEAIRLDREIECRMLHAICELDEPSATQKDNSNNNSIQNILNLNLL